jgi:hypothetical protein
MKQMKEHRQSGRQQEVRSRAGGRYFKYLVAREDSEVHGHGLGPTEVRDQRYDDRAEQADVGEGVERQPAQAGSRIVAVAVRRPRMGVLMDGQRNEKDGGRNHILRQMIDRHSISF